ncbi:MAG: threonylcarbamoyl-AMP synthase [Ruminococcus sp.]|nr:threonylcarbamoyl-AMP synthase [Ruminococcus sp.]
METILLQDNQPDIEKAAKIILGGGIVAVPTETVYGLAANALDGKAVEKIFRAKGRPMDNPLIVHISSVEMIERFGLFKEFTEQAKLLAEKFWPGPLTIILPKGDVIPDQTSAGLSTVAVRLPSHKTARELIRIADVPLAAPSANISGKPSPTSAGHCVNDLMGRVNAIIDGGKCSVGVESTVITLAENPPRLLRPGGITAEQLREVLGEVVIDSAVTHQLEKGKTASSPGMKYKHYAPKAQVYLVKGKNFAEFVNRIADSATAVICFDEDKGKFTLPVYAIGSATDYNSHARKIFEVLREIDKDEKTDTVYAPCPSVTGVSLAVYNRLIRAAAFRIINADVFVLGLVGPTGAGKSLAAKVFEQNGWHIVDADRISRTIYKKGSAVLEKLAEAFGSDIIEQDGTLNRKLLASRAFADKISTQRLNSITHPYIYESALLEIEEYSERGFDKFILDAPTLFESNGQRFCNKTLSVLAPLESRIRRITARDNLTHDEAMQRINAQFSDSYYTEKSDFCIINDGSAEALAQKVNNLIDGEL